MSVLMCLPDQLARQAANDLIIGYEPWDTRLIRWIVDRIDAAAKKPSTRFFNPNYEIERAREVLVKLAAKPGTGVAPEPDGSQDPLLPGETTHLTVAVAVAKPKLKVRVRPPTSPPPAPPKLKIRVKPRG